MVSVTQAAGRRRLSFGFRSPRFRDLLRRADQARDRDDRATAATLYEEALKIDPSKAHIRVQCGHMHKESGNFDRAEMQYLAAQAVLADDPDLMLQLGHFYKVAGRWTEAIAYYERAMALTPDAAKYAEEVARARRQRTDATLAQIRSAIELSFDANQYRQLNRDVAESGVNPLDHFLNRGVSEGRSCSDPSLGVEMTDDVWRDGMVR